MPTVLDYKLCFGVNKDFRITEGAKLVEAFMHNEMKRVTLIYHGLGSYTFNLILSSPLTVANDWMFRQESKNS